MGWKVFEKRVPQSNHPHVLLKGGENAIEELFPNITNELIEAGIVNNFTRDLKWHQFGLWKQPFIGEVHMIQQSRPLLEWHILKNEYIKFQILLLNMKHWLKGYW